MDLISSLHCFNVMVVWNLVHFNSMTMKSNYLRQSTNDLSMSQCKASQAIVNSIIFFVFLIVGNLIKAFLEKYEMGMTSLCDTNMFFTMFSLKCTELKHNQC